jgi:phosphate transport system substrate-binding protein
MKLRAYYIKTTLMALLASPIEVTIGFIGSSLLSSFIPNPLVVFIILSSCLPLLLLAGMWVLYSKKATLPEKASQLFLPFAIALFYYLCVWIIAFGGTHYDMRSDFFSIFTIPYFLINAFLLRFFPLISTAITVITVLSVVITCKICKKKILFDKKTIIYCSAALFLFGIISFQFYDKSTKFISEDYKVERIDDETDLYHYRLFSSDNKFKKLNSPATISFTENYPRLDGATALYPVYGAIVQELYKELNVNTVKRYVDCTTTRIAYERLIDGEIDIFFGLQPSQQQIEAARKKGVAFLLTPIAKEAFVFFVHKDNLISSLTPEQIQDIYQKKITNWRAVGGKAEKIMPFQRPINSGSQTIMLARIMGDKPLPPPLREEFSSGMDGIINQVAVYRNYSSSIGYSFRFFATAMNPNENIKLLAINGIAPSVENIRSGVYPFTVDVYAVTAGSTNENTEKLIQWILSEQGQSFIETCGYVRNE